MWLGKILWRSASLRWTHPHIIFFSWNIWQVLLWAKYRLRLKRQWCNVNCQTAESDIGAQCICTPGPSWAWREIFGVTWSAIRQTSACSLAVGIFCRTRGMRVMIEASASFNFLADRADWLIHWCVCWLAGDASASEPLSYCTQWVCQIFLPPGLQISLYHSLCSVFVSLNTPPSSSSSSTPHASPLIRRARGSHTKPGRDYDDSFVAHPPCPPSSLCLCPHSFKMKDGNNFLSVWCLKSSDIHLEVQVSFPAYGSRGQVCLFFFFWRQLLSTSRWLTNWECPFLPW